MTKTLGAMSALFLSFSLQATPIAGLYNTGVDNAGVPLPGGDGVAELHWLQNGNPAVTYRNPAYIPETLTGGGSDLSRWISNSSAGVAPASITPYTLTFSLPSSTASISGRWAADNCGTARLNGNAAFSSITNCTSIASFGAWTPFTITSGFRAGLNTLTFNLENISGATGIRIEFLSSDEGAGSSAVPEPSTYGLLGSTLALTALLHRCRR